MKDKRVEFRIDSVDYQLFTVECNRAQVKPSQVLRVLIQLYTLDEDLAERVNIPIQEIGD